RARDGARALRDRADPPAADARAAAPPAPAPPWRSGTTRALRGVARVAPPASAAADRAAARAPGPTARETGAGWRPPRRRGRRAPARASSGSTPARNGWRFRRVRRGDRAPPPPPARAGPPWRGRGRPPRIP